MFLNNYSICYFIITPQQTALYSFPLHFIAMLCQMCYA